MKRTFIAIALLLGLYACSNDTMDEAPQGQMCEVTLNVASLDVKDEPITRATSPANEALDGIYYSLVNTSTRKEYSGEQTTSKNPSDFGNIKLWLPSGSYEIYVMGAGKQNPMGTAEMYTPRSSTAHYISSRNKDTFLKVQTTQIEKQTKTIDVNLTRLSSALVIRLKDTLPVDIAKVKVNLSYYPIWIVENNKAVYEGNSGESTKFEDELTITENKIEEYTFYVLPQPNRNVTITLCDAFGAELGSTTVNVSFYQNRKTVIEGNILDVVQQRPLNVTVTDDWGEDNLVPLK